MGCVWGCGQIRPTDGPRDSSSFVGQCGSIHKSRAGSSRRMPHVCVRSLVVFLGWNLARRFCVPGIDEFTEVRRLRPDAGWVGLLIERFACQFHQRKRMSASRDPTRPRVCRRELEGCGWIRFLGVIRVCVRVSGGSPESCVGSGVLRGERTPRSSVVAEVDDRRQHECRAGMSPPARLFF
jgi:hypothetical protein